MGRSTRGRGRNQRKHRLSQPETQPYNLADMRSMDGASLRYEVETQSIGLALSMFEDVKSTGAYQALERLLPSPRLALFFERTLKDLIRPVVRSASVAKWHLEHAGQPTTRQVHWVDHGGLGPVLARHWTDPQISLRVGRATSLGARMRSARRRLRASGRRWVRRFRWLMWRPPDAGLRSTALLPEHAHLHRAVVHFSDGNDPDKRSDVFWLSHSGLAPGRILYSFDPRLSSNPMLAPHTINEHVLERAHSQGMACVWMEEPMLRRPHPNAWWPSDVSALVRRFRSACPRNDGSQLGRWVSNMAEGLLREVRVWQAFYTDFNVRVHFEKGEGGVLTVYHNVAQSIAADLVGGVEIGNQRSDMASSTAVRYWFHPDHVFFSWGAYAHVALEGSGNRNENLVVTGLSYDVAFQGASADAAAIRKSLVPQGARFVLAVYDNTFNANAHLSRGMLESFYTALLQWVIDDPEVGLVIKTKKAAVLDQLPKVYESLARAEASGRCAIIDDAAGMLPADAAHAADFTVGIGISTAVIEAAIVGKRGVHCDLPRQQSHQFYQWGYEQVIFDDLDAMMTALRRYKADPASEPHLGDHTPCLDQLDPFRDGRAGERVGSYIRSLLEAFDAGCDRTEAIRRANDQYAQQWGADKVVRLTHDAGEVIGSFPEVERG